VNYIYLMSKNTSFKTFLDNYTKMTRESEDFS